MAIPNFQASLDSDASTGQVDLTWAATSVDPDDIIFVTMEHDPATQPQNPNGYLRVGPSILADDTGLSVFWRRANGDETGVTLLDVGDHIVANACTVRGVITEGEPWNLRVPGVENTSDTSLSATGGTTTVNDCLIVVFTSNGLDLGTAQYGTWANADLSGTAEQVDIQSIQGNGGGAAIATGGLATAGTFGATTATLANAAKKAFLTIALMPTGAAAPTTPYLEAQLAQLGTDSSAVLTWDANEVEADDILLLFCETAAEAVSTPSGGWAEVADSPQEVSANTRLTVFWLRADGTETGVTVADPGDHLLVYVLLFRNCIPTGNPWDVTSGGTDITVDTTLVIPGDTTTVAGCLVLAVEATGTDVAGRALTRSWANADLADFHVVNDTYTSSGGGGGVAVAVGVKTAAGAYGNSTATLETAAAQAYMTIALRNVEVAGTFMPQIVRFVG